MRRAGTLQDADHHLLAIWAADCAQHVLHLFEEIQPNEDRRRHWIMIEQPREFNDALLSWLIATEK